MKNFLGQNIGFNVKEGDGKYLIFRDDDTYSASFPNGQRYYFAGYLGGTPHWTSTREDATVFRDMIQADRFAKGHKGTLLNIKEG